MHLTLGLHRALQHHPHAVATTFRGRRRTFGELGQRVAKLAAALQAQGMHAGDRVAMLSLNSDRYLEYYLAVFWGGGVVNPINIRWSPTEIAYSLDDCDTAILLVDDTFVPMVSELRSKSKALRTVIHAGEGETPAGMLPCEGILAAAEPVPDAMRSGDDLAGILYTGGTTGIPKGVMLSHASLFSNALNMLAEGAIADHCVGLHAAPMFHVADVTLMLAILLRGGTHAFLPAFTPAEALEVIARERVTDTLLVPTMIQMLVDHPSVKAHDTSSLRLIQYGASPISEAVLGRAFSALPGVAFMQLYGMTELSPVAAVLPPFFHTPEGCKMGKLRVLCGGSHRRRGGQGGAARQRRRGGGARRGGHEGLLEQARRNGRGDSRRVDAYRRRRLHGRGRIRLHCRPHQGHDRHRWRERLFGRGGERACQTSGSCHVRCDWYS